MRSLPSQEIQNLLLKSFDRRCGSPLFSAMTDKLREPITRLPFLSISSLRGARNLRLRSSFRNFFLIMTIFCALWQSQPNKTTMFKYQKNSLKSQKNQKNNYKVSTYKIIILIKPQCLNMYRRSAFLYYRFFRIFVLRRRYRSTAYL